MTSAAEQNRRQLAMHFAVRLLAEGPKTVLDAGAGAGLVLASCRKAGVPCVGLEPERAAARALADQGFLAVRGSAERLPFRERSFDWVVLRHVPHHLLDPRAALGEALRVARTGALVAEPWYDLSIPSQELGLCIERWRKRQHRRAGRIHAENLSPGDLMQLLPSERGFDVRIETALHPRSIPPAELESALNGELTGLAGGDPDRTELDLLRRRLRDEGATFCGTAMLVVKHLAPR